MDAFANTVISIISEQERIIGPLALAQANKVSGLTVNWPRKQIAIEGNKTKVLQSLIESYQQIFGQISVQVCRDAARGSIKDLPADQVPELLK